MIIVTPYLSKTLRPDQISKPDDGFTDASDPQSWLLGRMNRIYSTAGNPELVEDLPRPRRLHQRLSSGRSRRHAFAPFTSDMSMILTPSVSSSAVCARTARGASSPWRCSVFRLPDVPTSTERWRPPPIPDDYHQRHPVALVNARQSLDIFFVGADRPIGLPPKARRRVLLRPTISPMARVSIRVQVPRGSVDGRAADTTLGGHPPSFWRRPA